MMEKKVKMMSSLPSDCKICRTPFDKNNKMHAFTWHVGVNEAENLVDLFCDYCWQFVEKSYNYNDGIGEA